MITFLQGILEEIFPGYLIINVSGVGYKVIIPVNDEKNFGSIKKNTKILVHFHVREQEQTLFGFPDEESRDLFRLLINRVTGIGPKVAMSILGGMKTQEFKQSVVTGEISKISKIKGLGKKTAERIILELSDKVGVKEAWKDQGSKNLSPTQLSRNDALLALISLGYKHGESKKAIESVSETILETNEILRLSLKVLQG